MTESNLEIMKKIIEAKKQKSAEQGGGKRAPKVLGESRKGIKKYKKGGLFDK